ncbi:MAG: transcription-repair coupling factor [Armatimonadetes bacterium]|nr:transcription-repair coupling factor [Armatimonadota bacterium]
MAANWLEALRQRLELEPPGAPTEWADLCQEAKPPLFSAVFRSSDKPALIIASTLERAETWIAALLRLGFPEDRLVRLPSGAASWFDPSGVELEARNDRIQAMTRVQNGDPVVVVAPVSAALHRTGRPDWFGDQTVRIAKGEALEPEALIKRLLWTGYEHQDPVRLPGQFARRGGIVDFFPLGSGLPVRVEFFGDEIESLRRFEPSTQRSVKTMERATAPPAREIPLGNPQVAAQIRELWTDVEDDLLHADLGALHQGLPFDRLEVYLPWLEERPTCFIDFMPSDGLICLDEPLLIASAYQRWMEELQAALNSRAERHDLASMSAEVYARPLTELKGRASLAMSAMDSGKLDWFAPKKSIKIGAKSLESYRGRLPALLDTVKQWQASGLDLIVATDQATRVARAFQDQGIPYISNEEATELQPRIALLERGNLGGGFICETAKMALLTDGELFDLHRLRLPPRRFTEGVPISSVLDLKPGDYVVHIHQGIGMFRGLVTIERDGVTKEYLHIDYAPPDKIYVPSDQLDRVQKYYAADDKPPEIRRLNSLAWAKAVATARKKAQEIAGELVAIYARREKATRPSCGPDTPWQQEMELAFPYTETPGQMNAIVETKSDMMAPHPMDRLVCGDVGFGKTEVAVRAAFKALQEGRQVAVLCPTTVLAYQHWQTFTERFGAYPIRVELLSRLISAKNQKPIVQAIHAGAVDLVVGTHRLLSKDIAFKNLGLVIIDEEQRFGVMQKEKFKQLRATVDVMTLTATPIPRTLYMALTEIRDMSLISDPPPGRMPIRTHVQPHADWLVREAVLRELQRDGQIFYVHNRVSALPHIAEKLRQLAPHCRIEIAHGQMPAEEMESIMLAFYRREFDALVCTTIIENGLDIPNVNTLIVDQADKFGLSQLYQLRGRVGRSDRQAYAYFLYRPGQKLTDAAFDRLEALKEFSHLGSGFALAMRDLEIRGAGNLLGSEQHGAVRMVGFELYQTMLREEIRRLKRGGEAVSLDQALTTELPTLEIPLNAYIPKDYIKDDAQRLWYYKRLAGVTNEQELDDLKREIRDRYGPPPTPVKALARAMNLRLLAYAVGVAKIAGDRYKIEIELKATHRLPAKRQIELQKRFKGLRATPDSITALKPADLPEAIKLILTALTEPAT